MLDKLIPMHNIILTATPTFIKVSKTASSGNFGIHLNQMSQSHSFDWLTFFWGGALGTFIGALIILGIERILDKMLSLLKFHKQKSELTKLLNIEINSNISTIDEITTRLKESPKEVLYFKLDDLWMKTYSNKIIDYGNEESLRLYRTLKEDIKRIEVIHELNESIKTFSMTSKALNSYNDVIINMNNSIVLEIGKLKVMLDETQRLRRDNKIFDKDIQSELVKINEQN